MRLFPVEGGGEKIDGDEVGEVGSAEIRQFLSGAGGVQGCPDPCAGLIDEGQPPLQPSVACPLIRRDRLLRGAIDILETHRAGCDRHRVDQLRVLGETARLLMEQLKQTRVHEPVDALELTDLNPVLSESASEADGRGWRRDLGQFTAALKKVQNGIDMLGQTRRRKSGDVLVLPQLGKLAAQAL
ncbi:hypothetical protein [Streptomyces sp. NPDC020747]|uniref:hypothetical protein n=1 Tax=Streptomyces sp. NPDC020747 TaxID=3365086 RepID=UPI0037972092